MPTEGNDNALDSTITEKKTCFLVFKSVTTTLVFPSAMPFTTISPSLSSAVAMWGALTLHAVESRAFIDAHQDHVPLAHAPLAVRDGQHAEIGQVFLAEMQLLSVPEGIDVVARPACIFTLASSARWKSPCCR